VHGVQSRIHSQFAKAMQKETFSFIPAWSFKSLQTLRESSSHAPSPVLRHSRVAMLLHHDGHAALCAPPLLLRHQVRSDTHYDLIMSRFKKTLDGQLRTRLEIKAAVQTISKPGVPREKVLRAINVSHT
jgi:hypothetical protein